MATRGGTTEYVICYLLLQIAMVFCTSRGRDLHLHLKPKEEAVVFHWSGGKTDQIKQEAIQKIKYYKNKIQNHPCLLPCGHSRHHPQGEGKWLRGSNHGGRHRKIGKRYQEEISRFGARNKRNWEPGMHLHCPADGSGEMEPTSTW